MENIQNQNSTDTDVDNRGLHSSRILRCKDYEMSGLLDSIIPHLGEPMQINHIIMSLLPLQRLILASGRVKESAIS